MHAEDMYTSESRNELLKVADCFQELDQAEKSVVKKKFNDLGAGLGDALERGRNAFELRCMEGIDY